jgi:hypothetical protein
MAVNPGGGWLADPETTVDPYVNELRRNLARLAPPSTFNLAAARWQWATGNYALQTLLVAAGSLHRLHLSSPAQNAQDLCAAAHGLTVGRLTPIAGIPHSVSGLCDVAPHSSRFATVAAFERGNVAVLMQFASFTYGPISPRVAYTAVRQQYLTLPSGGVVVSSGADTALVAFWLAGLVALAVAVGLVIRRRGWREVAGSTVAAVRRRWLALAVSAVAVVGAMAFSMVDASLLHGSGQWYESSFNDFWRNWADSIYLTHAGGYAHLYRLDNTLETAPAMQVVMAPIARLAAGLHFPNPNPVLYPQAYWVAGPIFLAFMALPICGGDRWLAHMGVTDIRRRLAVLGTMGITLPVIALFGHSEDLVALGAMLYGLAAAFEGRRRATGWWIGVALAFQPFAILAVPIALVLLKRRDWFGAVVPMVMLPLAFLVVPLVGDFSLTVHQLVHQGVYDDVGYISPTWNLDPGVGAFVRALIALAAIPAALTLRRFLPRSSEDAANAIVWTVAVLFALRVFEPELLPYFMAPALALLVVSAARHSPWRLAAACLLAVWLNWWDHFAVDARWSMWFLLVGQLGLLGWLGWPVLQQATTRVVGRARATRAAATAP